MGDRCLSHIVWNFRMTAMILMYVDVMFLFCAHCVCVCVQSGWVVVGCVQSGMHVDCIH